MNARAPSYIGDTEPWVPRFAELPHCLLEPHRRTATCRGNRTCGECSQEIQQIRVITGESSLAGLAARDKPQEWIRHAGIVRPFPSGASRTVVDQ